MLYQTCQRCHTNVTVTADVCLPCEADQARIVAKQRPRPDCVMCGTRIPTTRRGSFVCSDQCQLDSDASMVDAMDAEDNLFL